MNYNYMYIFTIGVPVSVREVLEHLKTLNTYNSHFIIITVLDLAVQSLSVVFKNTAQCMRKTA